MAAGQLPSPSPLPLCVDLDGTLARTDTLWESGIRLCKAKPWLIPRALLALAGGRVRLKDWLSNHVTLDPALLPYHQDLLAWVSLEKAKGREIYLVTGAHFTIAESVARHFGLFHGVIATSPDLNLVGVNKARALTSRFAQTGYEYIGDSLTDLPVWKHAAAKGIVGTAEFISRQRATGDFQSEWTVDSAGIKAWLRGLRLHQWAKNALIFAPLALAHRLGDLNALFVAGCAFFAFGLTASAVYLINDLADLDADRRHPTKKHRPFASGLIPIPHALLAVPLLLASAAAIGYFFAPGLLPVLGFYFLATNLYSFRLKSIMIADVVALAGLYCVRILAGGLVTDTPISQWLLTFGLFIFFSLAVLKRFTEVFSKAKTDTAAIPGRGYQAHDMEQLSALGSAAGLVAALVLALYVSSDQVKSLYARPEYLWIAVPLLIYWINRMWILARRQLVQADPVVFALTDRVTYFCAGLMIICMLLAGPL